MLRWFMLLPSHNGRMLVGEPPEGLLDHMMDQMGI